MSQEKLISILESIFFVSDKPVSIERLQDVFGEETSRAEISEAIQSIVQKYEAETFGFQLREANGGFHFCTKAGNIDYVRKFLALKPFRLGRSALEVMAIIAYRQPITRAEIDSVRGIDSSHLLRTLIERGLVQMAGKADVPGRPVQYGTTRRFLEVAGLHSLGDLPPLSELEQLQGQVPDPNQRLEEGLERFVAGTVSRSDVPITGEDTSGLGEIDTLLSSIRKADEEVYESPLHAEVAQENVAAMEGLAAFLPSYKRQRNKHPSDLASEPSLGSEDSPVLPVAEMVTDPIPQAENAPLPPMD